MKVVGNALNARDVFGGEHQIEVFGIRVFKSAGIVKVRDGSVERSVKVMLCHHLH